jgi:7-cyano-7-deazaguanine synthase in queuosine biosynthesis
MTARLYFRAPGEKRRGPRGVTAVIHLDEPAADGYPLHHNLDKLPGGPHPPGSGAVSFLLTSLAVWAADKLLPRNLTPDAWTRAIELNLPAGPSWLRLAPRLEKLLNFLTGDVWVLKLRESHLGFTPQSRWEHPWLPDEVVLFSGGLDSLAGAVDRLEAGRRVLLLSHYDFGQLAATQQTLADALEQHYGPDRVCHLGLRMQFPEAPELTLRSRSLLYLGLAVAAAAALGAGTPVVIPENGWISLNLPLTASRLGSYSTRTTHPYFLQGLASLWREAGLAHPLVNPHQALTKGEVLESCRNRGLLKELCRRTVSCARPVVARWRGQGERGQESCGYCYPCLIRRAALNRLGWDEGADYGLDVLAEKETLVHRVRGRDLRALLLALKTWDQSPWELEARWWLGESPGEILARYPQARAVLAAGFAELSKFFGDKGPEWVKEYLT